MPLREQMGIILIAAVVGFMIASIGLSSGDTEGVQHLGYDLPSAIYSQRPGETSNKFRVSLIPNEDMEEVKLSIYWLRSRSVPNSTVLDPDPVSDKIQILSAFTSTLNTSMDVVETEVEYNGSRLSLYMYDFSPLLRATGGETDSPTCFAFLLGPGPSVIRYFEGYKDIFPFKAKTLSSVHMTSGGSTEIYSQDVGGDGSLDDPKIGGSWTVESPRENELVELLALLSEDARLYIDANWGTSALRMQVTILRVNGEISEIRAELT